MSERVIWFLHDIGKAVTSYLYDHKVFKTMLGRAGVYEAISMPK